jgi:hypothetical protein
MIVSMRLFTYFLIFIDLSLYHSYNRYKAISHLQMNTCTSFPEITLPVFMATNATGSLFI